LSKSNPDAQVSIKAVEKILRNADKSFNAEKNPKKEGFQKYAVLYDECKGIIENDHIKRIQGFYTKNLEDGNALKDPNVVKAYETISQNGDIFQLYIDLKTQNPDSVFAISLLQKHPAGRATLEKIETAIDNMIEAKLGQKAFNDFKVAIKEFKNT